MTRAVVDTHALIWYIAADPRLSLNARAAIDSATGTNDEIGVSSITLTEIVYLVEKRRIEPTTLEQVLDAINLGETLIEIPVDRSIALAMRTIPRAEVPDMPDRIIAATALHLGVPVISRDGKIRASSVATIW